MIPMDNITPDDIPLPAFLDPLLSYLDSVLPPPLYSFLITLMSQFLALFTALFSLITAIPSKPWEWDAQTLLPPLITVLAAYLALLTMYRTATWMVRTSAWFIKWGTIIGALFAGAGWYMGNANAVGALGGGGVISGLGGLILDMINGQGQNAAGGSRYKTRTQSKASRAHARKTGNRPKPWDSFEQHREWQYRENDAGDDGNDIQKVIGDIAGAAGRVVRESGWWEAAKSVVVGMGGEDDSNGDVERRSSERRKRTKGEGNSRSR